MPFQARLLGATFEAALQKGPRHACALRAALCGPLPALGCPPSVAGDRAPQSADTQDGFWFSFDVHLQMATVSTLVRAECSASLNLQVPARMLGHARYHRL